MGMVSTYCQMWPSSELQPDSNSNSFNWMLFMLRNQLNALPYTDSNATVYTWHHASSDVCPWEFYISKQFFLIELDAKLNDNACKLTWTSMSVFIHWPTHRGLLMGYGILTHIVILVCGE